ncbi:hypothetical protein F5972_20345 [Microbispora cellulosiformans]|uniref:Uncharacterized protein n=1 Tax=Microbispora cellulosiformans TaxID=2614688 RepID=A0A5J5JYD5_9ACTN|nr:hypothetical protein [Microbispora cellulosiformans]KAA9376828.1 hypothetical protein F5972_20345 [Microbispora cellulosiformans]
MVTLLAAGCTIEPEQPKPPSAVAFTPEMAESVLAEVVAGVGKNGVADFCAKFARSIATCEALLKIALGQCLLPGDKPIVKNAVHLPATGTYEETWQLVVQGRTLDGQKYVSDFPIVLSAGAPKAVIGVYWTGQGYGRNMDAPRSTRSPRRTPAPGNVGAGRVGLAHLHLIRTASESALSAWRCHGSRPLEALT